MTFDVYWVFFQSINNNDTGKREKKSLIKIVIETNNNNEITQNNGYRIFIHSFISNENNPYTIWYGSNFVLGWTKKKTDRKKKWKKVSISKFNYYH